MGNAWNIRSRSASPHSTSAAKAAHTRASLRPPIFNPYDRFPQPEFDAWIEDITSALKRALDHEPEPTVNSPSRHSGIWNTIPDHPGGTPSAEGRAWSPALSDAHDEDSPVEDSFSQITSRRAKGKARDPREGPGLGLKGQPIELLSDSEEEEVVESLEADAVASEGSDSIIHEGSSGEADYAESEVDDYREANVEKPGTSTQHIITFLSSEVSAHDQELASHFDAKAHRTRGEDFPLPRNTDVSLEDDGDRNESFAVMGNMRGTHDDLSQSATPFDVELTDPWDGPRTFAEDYYSGGDRLVPGLTPHYLTPLSRSPAPTLPGLSTIPNAGPDEDRPPLFPSILSTSPSPKLQDMVDGNNVIGGVLQHRPTVATPVDQGDVVEPAPGSYFDRVGVNEDVTVYIVEDTEPDAGEGADGASINKASPIGKEISTSYSARSNMETNGRDPDRGHEIIWALPSDDENTDADVEGDEEKFSGILPLGTSDLDIRDDWYPISGRKDADYTSEEDELEEMESIQTAHDIANTAALALSQFSETVVPSDLNAPPVEPRPPILASTFQLSDADSFGDLPVSSPPSETPSPAPDQPTEALELQQRSIEQLFADLEREASERRSQVSEPPGLLARQPEAGTANSWASRELEHILSGEMSVPVNAAGDSGSASAKRSASQEAAFPTQFPEYIVEEDKVGTEVDDLGDTRSIPPPDLAEVGEMVQLYEVEEPRTDGRLTEEPEIMVTSPLHPVASSIESTATPVTAEHHMCPVPPQTSDTLQTRRLTTVPDIPAPIVADPSVPDPVPGDSFPPSPLFRDSSGALGLSTVPPAVLRVMDHGSAQISSGTSGLFTPAQRSEGGTPRQLEDDAAESLTTPHDAANRGLESASDPLRTEGDSSPIESPITADEGGGNAKDKDGIGENELTEPFQSVSSNRRQIRIGFVDAGTQNPGVDAVESTDEGSSPSGHGSAKPTVSQSLEGDSSFRRVPSEHSGIEFVPGTPNIAEGDNDADGEADPDCSPTHGTKQLHQGPAHQPVGEGREIPSSKIRIDALGPNVITSDLKSLTTSASAQKQEMEPVGETSLHDVQDDPSAERRNVQEKGDLTAFVQSDVKASHGKEHPTRALKRKRRDPETGSARITRSKSGISVPRGKKKGPVLSSHRATTTTEKAQFDRVGTSIDADFVDDGASEVASVSSGASAVYRLLHATSRAGSVDSSGSGDAPWSSPLTSGPGRVIPLVHSHGLHHGWSVHPPPNPPTPSSSHHKEARPEQAKAKSPAPAPEPSTPSIKWSPSTNSPVTRSNCRFHKISLPSGEERVRARFVVPGCSLGDGEVMANNDIRDEGFSTHEDHKRMLPDVEMLDLSPYLIGVLRQLVGVDLLREQQEIFYLPGEEEKPKKRRKTGALESLRQFRRQSMSSAGPLARDHSPQPSEVSHDRGSTFRSVSGSARSASLQEESENGDSALSDPDDDDDRGELPPAKRHKSSAGEMVPSLEFTQDSEEPASSVVLERSTLSGKEPTSSSRPSATRRSRRRNHNYDAAAYKPGEDDVKDDEQVEETKTRRSRTRRAPKRSRTMEETSANPPRSKKLRLGRSISMADAGAAS